MKRSSLENQCKELDLPLEEVQLDYEGRPEPALLKYYESLGYVGSFIEGYTILTVLKALMLDKLAAFNTFNDRNDACTRYLEAQLTIHKDKVDEIISSMKNTSKIKYHGNLKKSSVSHLFRANIQIFLSRAALLYLTLLIESSLLMWLKSFQKILTHIETAGPISP